LHDAMATAAMRPASGQVAEQCLRRHRPHPASRRSHRSPLLALTGALLYRLDPGRLLPLSVGLLILGIWLACYDWRHVIETDAERLPSFGLERAKRKTRQPRKEGVSD
jgi:hypothetical protein